eukprot:CAMPEP_0113572586 /NCGR_PEP_ID=MMETSP0015_2-20120614/26169_1 /TAXON_ID=2838 /ORGANISM="Odontella" /LENGTH=864 /DNA_ID=CAMNT_0000475619 /DNA_START=56 /DNA_END=2650 /DNA_ORIENTATION=- /assembly_acc=CAM_ASM_000160
MVAMQRRDSPPAETQEARARPPTSTSSPSKEDGGGGGGGGGTGTGEGKGTDTGIPKSRKKDYYTSGCTDLAQPTALTLKKLEKRRQLTANSDRLVIVLVGLPGRGKSFVARKLSNYLTWRGTECRIFNVGKYRREAAANLARREQQQQQQQHSSSDGGEGAGEGGGTADETGACDANFFDSNNAAAARLREEVAAVAMKEMLGWLDRPEEGAGGAAPPPPPKVSVSGTGSGSSPSSNGPSRPSGAACRSSSNSTNWQQGRRDPSDYSHTRSARSERVAIYDATNSTRARRKWILEEVTSSSYDSAHSAKGVVFVESICDDEELLEENFRFKVQNSPDFEGMSEDEAIADLRNRVAKYEEQYQTVSDDSLSYIKIFNLSSKLMVNHIYGRMAKIIVPSLMSWNIGNRPIYITRAGETVSLSLAAAHHHRRSQRHLLRANGGGGGNNTANGNVPQSVQDMKWRAASSTRASCATTTTTTTNGRRSGGNNNNNNNNNNPLQMSALSRGSRLAERGMEFRDALCEFVRREGKEFILSQKNATRDLNTGTSVNALKHRCASWGGIGDEEAEGLKEDLAHLDRSATGHGFTIGDEGDDEDEDEDDEDLDRLASQQILDRMDSYEDDFDASGRFPFPCHVMSSTMPRSVETARWERLPYPIEELSNLNPLDKGDFTGHELEDIATMSPEWYAQLESDPFRTRFPGGECYGDLINRLEPAIIDMEQQVGPVVVVSHVSVIQALVAYFRSTPVQKCTSIEVPLHTVIKFTPSRGGGWVESRHKLLDDREVEDDDDDLSDDNTASTGRTSSEGGEEEARPSSAEGSGIGERGTLDAVDKSPIPIWGDHFKPLSRKNSLNREEVSKNKDLAAPML